MEAHILIDVLVGVAIVIGLIGAVVQVFPGLLLVGGAVLVWGLLTGGTVGWTTVGISIVLVIVGMVAKYVIAGRYMFRQGVQNRSVIIGAVFGIIGFFVIPVVGLFVGFVGGIYLAELQRLQDPQTARASTWVALKATGLSILIELAAALLLTAAWVVALFMH